MISGDNFGLNSDDPVSDGEEHRDAALLGAYMESMPSTGYLGDFWPSSANPLYASKHNPFVLFDDIRSSNARLAHVKPYTSLAHDLNGSPDAVPDFAYIVPNQCHDMHGGVYTPVATDGSDGTPCPYG